MLNLNNHMIAKILSLSRGLLYLLKAPRAYYDSDQAVYNFFQVSEIHSSRLTTSV